MTILFLPAQNRQRYILGIFVACVILGAGVLWYIYGSDGSISVVQGESLPPPKEVEINFAIFSDPSFLQLGEPRPPIGLPSEVGKRNPFE